MEAIRSNLGGKFKSEDNVPTWRSMRTGQTRRQNGSRSTQPRGKTNPGLVCLPTPCRRIADGDDDDDKLCDVANPAHAALGDELQHNVSTQTNAINEATG